MNLIFWLAKKLAFNFYNNKSLKTMVCLTSISIIISNCALVLSLAIIHGFEIETKKQLQTIYPDLIIENNFNSFSYNLNYFEVEKEINKNFSKEILAISPKDSQQVIVYNPELENGLSSASIITGINPNLEIKTSNLNNKIINNNLLNLKNNFIILGYKLASNYNLKPGDQVTLLTPDSNSSSKNKIYFHNHKAKILALFKTNIDDLDSNLVYCNLNFLNQIFNKNISQIGVKLNKNINKSLLIKKLKKNLNLAVFSWEELYGPLLITMNLEKIVAGIILFLILLLSSINILTLNFMLISTKTIEITILKFLGLANYKIQAVFVYISLIITLFSSITGMTLAYVLGIILNKSNFINFSEIYLITNLPIKFELVFFGISFTISLFLSIISGYWPTKNIKYYKIAKIFKQNT